MTPTPGYEAFAKAEAYMLENVLVSPTTTTSHGP